jgi:hypothetical protein
LYGRLRSELGSLAASEACQAKKKQELVHTQLEIRARTAEAAEAAGVKTPPAPPLYGLYEVHLLRKRSALEVRPGPFSARSSSNSLSGPLSGITAITIPIIVRMASESARREVSALVSRSTWKNQDSEYELVKLTTVDLRPIYINLRVLTVATDCQSL